MFRKLFNKTIPATEGIIKLGQQMIDNPLDWVQGMYCFTNLKNKDIAIWTCNGISCIKIGGFTGLSYSDKVYINNCIKISMANRLLQSI